MKTLVLLILALFFTHFNSESQVYREKYTTGIILYDSTFSGNTITISSPGPGATTTFTLPSNAGSANQFLTTDGLGALSWSTISGSASPVGIDGSLQYNNSGSMGGDTLLSFNDALNTLFVGVNQSSATNSVVASDILIGKVGSDGQIRIAANGTSNYMILNPSASMSQNLTLEFPAENGDAMQALVTDGNGVLSWGGNVSVGPISRNDTRSDNSVSNGADNSYIGGGNNNDIENSPDNVGIYGGSSNEIDNNSDGSILIGGTDNDLDNQDGYCFLFGGQSIDITNNSQSSGIASGNDNTLNNSTDYGVILGGSSNSVDNSVSSIVLYAGEDNSFSNSSDYSVILGGFSNNMEQSENAYIGGRNNVINNNGSDRVVFFGGEDNELDNAPNGIVLSGQNNTGNSDFSVILTGSNNTVGEDYSVVLYGENSQVGNNSGNSIAGGREVLADNRDYQVMLGSYIDPNNDDRIVLFGDSNSNTLDSDNADEWGNRFTGGYRLFTNTALSTGVQMNGNQSSWSSVSDSTKKQMLLKLDDSQVYDKISDLPIYSWTYIGSDLSQRNYSPMAQDFYRLFGRDGIGQIGTDTTITELDLTSILLASTKGAQSELELKSQQVESLKTRTTSIQNRLNKIRSRINKLESKK